LRGERKLQVSGNQALRKTNEPIKVEVSEQFRILYNEFVNVKIAKYFYNSKIKDATMSWSLVMLLEITNTEHFLGKLFRKRPRGSSRKRWKYTLKKDSRL
jgi:uncharacterized protein (DUF2164 family)